MMYSVKTANFNPQFEVVSCFIEHEGKFIVLRKDKYKSQGGRWGLPAGKIESGENITKAILREVKEETRLSIPEGSMNYFGKTFHRHGNYNFIFHTFFVKLNYLPEVIINSREHQEFSWKTPEEIVSMKKDEIVEDFDSVCKIFYKI